MQATLLLAMLGLGLQGSTAARPGALTFPGRLS